MNHRIMGDGCWLAVSGIILFIPMEEKPWGKWIVHRLGYRKDIVTVTIVVALVVTVEGSVVRI